jgi:c-di-GMP-binding flagellar brake protein YcgR
MSNATQPRRDELGLWDRVVVILEKYGQRTEFISRIEDLRRDSYVLEMPLRQSGELHLQRGDTVEVTYNRSDAVYSFKASILDLFEGTEESISIKRSSDTKRTQRRKYVRLDISGNMQFRTFDDDDRENIGPENSGTLLNISACGVLFESQLKLEERGFIIVSFSLKDRLQLNNIMGVVKRCEGSKSRGYLVGAEFITKQNKGEYEIEHIEEFLPPGTGTFDENLQKLLVQFIYSQQVELRKKGLLNK